MCWLASISTSATARQGDARDKACGDLRLLPCRYRDERAADAALPSAYCLAACREMCDKSTDLTADPKPAQFSGWYKKYPSLDDALTFNFQQARKWVDDSAANSDPLRPYFVLLYAGIVSAADDPWAAETTVIDWLIADDAGSKTSNGVNWRRIRLLSFAASLLDEMGDTSPKAQRLRLILSEKLVEALSGLEPYAAGLKILHASIEPLAFTDEGDFTGAAPFTNNCKLDAKSYWQVYIATIYISDALRFADLAEQSNDWSKYAIQIAEIMHGLHLDLSCLRFEFNDETHAIVEGDDTAFNERRDLWQAEIRRLEAKRLLLDTADNDDVLDASDKRARFAKASMLAEAGLSVCYSAHRRN